MVSELTPPFPAPVVGLPASAETLLLQHEVEQLLYQEARIPGRLELGRVVDAVHH